MHVANTSGPDAHAKDGRYDPGYDLVHADALRFFPELVGELGGDPSRILEMARIDLNLLQSRSGALEYGTFVNLLEIAARQLNRPDFGILLARYQKGSKVMGPVGVVMKNSETLGQALGYCKRHIHAYCLATRVRFIPDRARHTLFLEIQIMLDGVPQRQQVVEHGVMLANLNIMDITGDNAQVREVHFRHKRLSPYNVYKMAFGCEVKFEQSRDGFLLTEQDLLCPISEPDPQLYEMATSFVETRYPVASPPTRARVRLLIERFLGAEDCTNERISAELCMHPRTLQRRLKAEGTSFEKIKDEVRRDIALNCLSNPDIPLIKVAERLGYAEASVLTRSCSRWFSASPSQVRNRSILGKAAMQVQ